MPTGFAATTPLSEAELRAAPVRYPRPSHLEQPLSWTVPTVGEAAALLGIHTVGDLLHHLPRDSGEGRTIEALVEGEVATIVVEVRRITSRAVRRRGMKPLVQAMVVDGTGALEATFFNQPWLHRQYVPGTRLVLAGKYQGGNRFRVNSHAVTDELVATGAAVAQYPATKGITSTQLLAAVQAQRACLSDEVDALPLLLRRAEALPDRVAALTAAHFGDHEAGRRRLAFDELLLDQIVQLRLRAQRRGAHAATPLDAPPAVSAHWRAELLPFAPTGDQDRAMAEIDADLARDRPMQRLLMGEVGSGKTVVALHAMLRAVDSGRQASLMAPTETLAEQHFATLSALLPGLDDDGLLAGAGAGGVRGALLTGSTTNARRRAILERLAGGDLDLIVGTHALIEPDVAFADLALAVVDEQHRFGVRQRSALDGKARPGHMPHVLHMTATPIPRTLRLVSFGALDVTALRELPKGRQPTATHVVSGEKGRERAYERLREELRAGRQAFVVCPLVSESDALAARAATAEYERLKTGELVDFEVVLMHGQMKSKDKAAVMARFAAGEADVLVATTVIEVGIDVPNATVMLVEDAERYGISQLHQLRGRVGRGEHASLCLLFGPGESRRLQALRDHTDGFRLAEIDLELRGEGEITGTRQSGLARHRFARLPEDGELLARAHARAQLLLDADPSLADADHALLATALADAEAEALSA